MFFISKSGAMFVLLLNEVVFCFSYRRLQRAPPKGLMKSPRSRLANPEEGALKVLPIEAG
jgi:hypothetical protein